MVKQTTQGAVTILALDTPVDAEAGAQLLERVTTAPRGGRPQFVIDLSASALIDSAGCEALLDLRDTATSVGGAAHLACAGPLCEDILVATGLFECFQIHETVNEAVASFAR